MPGTNSILPFSGATGANNLSDSDYLGAGQRLIGNQPGIASAQLNNKALKQATLMAAGLAQFIANRQATNISDSLTPSQIEACMVAAGLQTQGPCFSVYLSASQSVSGSFEKVKFNAKEFDTASAFDAVTNFRFNPQTAGYYQINGQASFTKPTGGGAADAIGSVSIRKNGTVIKTGPFGVTSTSSGGYAGVVSGLVLMNGSTDYLELFCQAGATTEVTPYLGDTFFQGSFVRGL